MAKIIKANYMGKTQHQLITQYCKDFGSISPMESFKDLGITKLATRVSEMQVNGFQFVKTKESTKTRFGGNANYKRYKIVGHPPV